MARIGAVDRELRPVAAQVRLRGCRDASFQSRSDATAEKLQRTWGADPIAVSAIAAGVGHSSLMVQAPGVWARRFCFGNVVGRCSSSSHCLLRGTKEHSQPESMGGDKSCRREMGKWHKGVQRFSVQKKSQSWTRWKRFGKIRGMM